MQILLVSLFAWFLAQGYKVVVQIVKNKKICLHYFVASGGMPSSHTSLVISLTTQVVLLYGFNSVYFAICAVLSAIVMYDATGVRRAVGLQAKKINQIINSSLIDASCDEDDDEKLDNELKEVLGHTPFEVLGGVILGITVATIFHFI